MKKHLIPLIGILVAVVFAAVMAAAGSTRSGQIAGWPVFALCGLLAFTVQWLLFVPAYLLQTERFYDLAGSLTYIALALIGLGLAPQIDGPRLLIAGLVVLWAARLGSFLFSRIRADGEDVRFRRIKPYPLRFLLTWTLQGLWVYITFAPGLAAITSTAPAEVGAWTLAGAAIWLIGFVFEVVADRQKRAFRSDPANSEHFISHGLWRYSRHPNYFGEIVLWTGIAITAFPLLSGWQHLTLVSPVFVYLLLTRISGINMLEARGKERWGDDPAYREYCRRTPVLFPRP